MKGVKIDSGSVVFNTIDDELRIAWSDLHGLSLLAGDTLLSLELLVKHTPGASNFNPFSLMNGCELADLMADPIDIMTFLTPQLLQPLSLEERNISGFTIYPNPATDKITLSFQLAATTKIECYLTDMAGKNILTFFNREFDQGKYSNIIDVSELQLGIYIICYKADNGAEKQMICKRLAIL